MIVLTRFIRISRLRHFCENTTAEECAQMTYGGQRRVRPDGHAPNSVQADRFRRLAPYPVRSQKPFITVYPRDLVSRSTIETQELEACWCEHSHPCIFLFVTLSPTMPSRTGKSTRASRLCLLKHIIRVYTNRRHLCSSVSNFTQRRRWTWSNFLVAWRLSMSKSTSHSILSMVTIVLQDPFVHLASRCKLVVRYDLF